MAHRERVAIIAAFAGLSLAACAPASVSPTVGATVSPSASPEPTSTPSASPTPALPAGFQPEHLTAISETDFWVAGIAGCAGGSCPPVILHTLDGGRTFERIPAPSMIVLDGNPSTPGLPSVVDIRFANASDGWLFGDQLWATHDGGAHWRQIDLGLTVDQLEPGADGYVYATLEHCGTSGSPCVYRTMRSQAHTDSWSLMEPPGNPSGHPVMGIHGDTVWLMYFIRSTRLAWTSHDAGHTWVVGSMPCEPDLIGSFDPVSVSVIWAFCATGMQGGPWVSTNGGLSFSSGPSAGGAFSNGGMVAALSPETAFIADPGTGLLRVTHNQGRTYQAVAQLAGARWAGFTDAEVGYVITQSQGTGATRLWRTTDAGAQWSVVTLS